MNHLKISDVINSFSEYPEDIQQEAMKILNDGLLFEEIQNSVSLTHQGDYTSRDALILMEASLFVDGKGNTLNSVHGLIGGDSGGGKSDGDKLIVICPFHDDHNPSGVIFKERFHCSTCNLTLNYYDFIGKLEGTNDKGKIMEKLHEMIG